MPPQTPQVPNGSPLPTDNNPTPPPAPQPSQAAAPVPSPAAPQPPVPPVAPAPVPLVDSTASSLPVQPVAPLPQPMPSSMAPMPQPASTPALTPEPQSVMTSSSYKQGRNFSKKIILASIIVGALLLIGGGVFAFTKITNGVKLVQYSDEDMEILYPKGYETKKSKVSGGVEFKEPSNSKTEEDSEKGDRSKVVVVTSDIGDASEDEKKQFFDKLEENIKKDNISDSGEVVIDKSERTKHNGNDAIKIKGTYKIEGKKAGTIKVVGALTQDKLYIVIVAAHISDPGVEKKADTIIDSIKLK